MLKKLKEKKLLAGNTFPHELQHDPLREASAAQARRVCERELLQLSPRRLLQRNARSGSAQVCKRLCRPDVKSPACCRAKDEPI